MEGEPWWKCDSQKKRPILHHGFGDSLIRCFCSVNRAGTQGLPHKQISAYTRRGLRRNTTQGASQNVVEKGGQNKNEEKEKGGITNCHLVDQNLYSSSDIMFKTIDEIQAVITNTKLPFLTQNWDSTLTILLLCFWALNSSRPLSLTLL